MVINNICVRNCLYFKLSEYASKVLPFHSPDKQGDHPINVSISLFGERLCTSIGYGISPSKWDEATQRVKKNASNAKKIQYNLINSRISSIQGHFERLEAIEKKLTKEEMRPELATLIKRKNDSFQNRQKRQFL